LLKKSSGHFLAILLILSFYRKFEHQNQET